MIENFCDYAGYESVFDKKAFGSELEVIELESFFKECDMYPSASEIDEAIDVVFHGKDYQLHYSNIPNSENIKMTSLKNHRNDVT